MPYHLTCGVNSRGSNCGLRQGYQIAIRGNFSRKPAFTARNRHSTTIASSLSTSTSNDVKPASTPTTTQPLPPTPPPPVSAALPLRKTKIVATIGPASNTKEMIIKLADAGVNVVRLNMSHGTHASHLAIINLVKEFNSLDGRSNLAILLDTKGPEVRSGDLNQPLELSTGDTLTLTIAEGADGADNKVSVNYDGFVEDVSVGDIVLVDGGLMSMEVKSIVNGTDVICTVIDGGELSSRRHLNIRGKSANLPAITERDWADIKFGVEHGVDYFALSFVRDAEAIIQLNEWLRKEGRVRKGLTIPGVISKIESADSVANLDEILDASAGAMVARGDLGAELPLEEVPFWQEKIVAGCRARGKPVIVATNMLESMITHAIPTRAEVADIAVAVREGADAVMLSGETAYGSYPVKAVEVMATVARRTEQGMLQRQLQERSYLAAFGSTFIPPSAAASAGSALCSIEPSTWVTNQPRPGVAIQDLASRELSEIMAFSACNTADAMSACIVVFTRRGFMPTLLSHFRNKQQIFAFTDSEDVKRKLALYHGVTAFSTYFSESAETTFDRALEELKERGLVHGGQLLVLVQSSPKPIWPSASPHVVQVRQVPLSRGGGEAPSESDSEW